MNGRHLVQQDEVHQRDAHGVHEDLTGRTQRGVELVLVSRRCMGVVMCGDVL